MAERVAPCALRRYHHVNTVAGYTVQRRLPSTGPPPFRLLTRPSPCNSQVQPAPGPEEVNWPALWSSWRERDWRTMLVRPLVLLVVLFPVGIFTGGLMQLVGGPWVAR